MAAANVRPTRVWIPSAINGDEPLTRAEREAYLLYHAERNAANWWRSACAGERTTALPLGRAAVSGSPSPARWALAQFFDHAARELKPHVVGRAITVLDLGCGRGTAVLPHLVVHGYAGRYIGLDVRRHERWSDAAAPGFTKELIVADIDEFDERRLPAIDLLVSATSLEHLRDDAGALARLRTRLSPGAGEAHFVPGEGALPLYTTHGWRQYSPACLRERFPAGEIYRAGGRASAWVHRRFIGGADGDAAFRNRRPGAYHAIVRAAARVDRVLGNTPATMYGVLVRPGPIGWTRTTADGSESRRAA